MIRFTNYLILFFALIQSSSQATDCTETCATAFVSCFDARTDNGDGDPYATCLGNMNSGRGPLSSACESNCTPTESMACLETDSCTASTGTQPENTGGNAGGSAGPTYSDISYSIHELNTFDLYTADSSNGPTPLLIYVHGGGWARGDKADVRPQFTNLRNMGISVASINYRFSDESYPAPVTDVKAAIRFFRANAAEYSLDPNRFIVAGASAGAHLASMMGTSIDVPVFEDASLGNGDTSSAVQAVIVLYGASDFATEIDDQAAAGCDTSESTGGSIGRVIDCNPPFTTTNCLDRLAEVSPITHVDGNEPPFWIIHGSEDCTVAPRQTERLHEALLAQGRDSERIVVQGGQHTPSTTLTTENTVLMQQWLQRVIISPPLETTTESQRSHCNYPWQTIPQQKGEDFASSGRPSEVASYGLWSYCMDTFYAVFPEELCTAVCHSDASITETWECLGDDAWQLVSDSATCPQATTTQPEPTTTIPESTTTVPEIITTADCGANATPAEVMTNFESLFNSEQWADLESQVYTDDALLYYSLDQATYTYVPQNTPGAIGASFEGLFLVTGPVNLVTTSDEYLPDGTYTNSGKIMLVSDSSEFGEFTNYMARDSEGCWKKVSDQACAGMCPPESTDRFNGFEVISQNSYNRCYGAPIGEGLWASSWGSLGVKVSTAADCALLCKKHDGCNFAVWNEETGNCSEFADCNEMKADEGYLFTSMYIIDDFEPKVEMQYCTGEFQVIYQRTHTRCLGAPIGKGLWGTGWGSLGVKVFSAAECAQLCQNDDGCEFAVWNEENGNCSELADCDGTKYDEDGLFTSMQVCDDANMLEFDLCTGEFQVLHQSTRTRCWGPPIGEGLWGTSWGALGVQVSTAAKCAQLCQNDDGCEFAVWNEENGSCSEFAECDETKTDKNFLFTSMQVCSTPMSSVSI